MTQMSAARRRRRVGRTCRALGLVTLGYVGLCTMHERQARAGVLGDLGRILGSPLGGFLDSATTPVIQNTESTAHRLIDQVDTSVDSTLNHTDKIVATTLDHVDSIAKGQLGLADNIMAARISQVDMSATQLVAQTIGGLSAIEGKAFKDLDITIAKLNDDLLKDLASLNLVLEGRLEQLNGIVQDAITQVDDDVAARIRQADDVIQKTIGTADVVATKQSLNLEGIALKVGSLLGLVAFLVGALKYTFEHLPDPDDVSEDERTKQVARPRMTRAGVLVWRRTLVWGKGALWILTHLAVGALAVSVFLFLAFKVGPRKEQAELIATYQKALASSGAALDLTKVRYVAAELAVIDPDGEAQYHATVVRTELLRTVLYRPGLLASASGVRQITMQVDEARRADKAAAGVLTDAGVADDDTGVTPDVMAAACYVRWQLARTRGDEFDAATLCTEALVRAQSGDEAKSAFILRPLAVRYVGFFLERPTTSFHKDDKHPYDPAEMAGWAKPLPTDGLPILGDAARFDELVDALDVASTKAYLAMLDAQVKVLAAAPPGTQKKPDNKVEPTPGTPLAERKQHATEVIQAWADFDAKVASDPQITGSNIVIGLFSLNDAPLAEALWFYVNQQDTAKNAPPIREEKDPTTRAKMTPVRANWARRYLEPLGAHTQQIAGFEAANRYLAFEKQTTKFEEAYVAYKRASASPAPLPEDDVQKKKQLTARLETKNAAAEAAAALGLYVTDPTNSSSPRAPLGDALLRESYGSAVSAEEEQKVTALNNSVRLRLL